MDYNAVIEGWAKTAEQGRAMTDALIEAGMGEAGAVIKAEVSTPAHTSCPPCQATFSMGEAGDLWYW